MLIRLILLLAGILYGSVAFGQSILSLNPSFTNSSSATPVFSQVHIGGGGFTREIQIAADGTKVVGTDSFNGYIWDASYSLGGSSGAWEVLFDSRTLPAIDPANVPFKCRLIGCGVYALAIAPSNTNIAYGMYAGYLYYTSNLQQFNNPSNSSHINWTATGLPYCSALGAVCPPNGATMVHRMAVDPNTPGTVILGEGTAFKYSTNSGSSWSTNATVPSGSGTGIAVCYVGTSSSNIYAFSPGNGLYYSSTGPSGTFSNVGMSGSPTTVSQMTCGTDGVVYITTANADSYVYIWHGSWTASSTNSQGVWVVDVDPAYPTYASNAHLVAMSAGGGLLWSVNSGSSWIQPGYNGGPTGAIASACTSPIVPWIAWTDNCGATLNSGAFSPGTAAFDPSQSSVVWVSTGVGPMYWNLGNYGTVGSTKWTYEVQGIEQLVATRAVAASGVAVGIAWDRPEFVFSPTNAYPSITGIAAPQAAAIVPGSSADYLQSNSQDWAASSGSGSVGHSTGVSGKSTNGGSTWTAWTDYSGVGDWSNIAVGSSLNYIWSILDGAPGQFTSNGGTSWSQMSATGLSGSGDQGFVVNSETSMICHDTVNAGIVYAYAPGASTPGVYKWSSSAAGNRVSGKITTTGGPSITNAFLKCVPGNAGELIFSTGWGNSGNGFPDPQAQLIDCQDSTPASSTGSLTCVAFNVYESEGVGLGAAQSGGFPSIYIWGWVGGALTSASYVSATGALTLNYSSYNGTLPSSGALESTNSMTISGGGSCGTLNGTFPVASVGSGTMTLSATAGLGSCTITSSTGLVAEYGLWACDGYTAGSGSCSWKFLTQFPYNWTDQVVDLDCDKATWRECYWGYEGSSWGEMVP